jgi:site-specific DNA recombinase
MQGRPPAIFPRDSRRPARETVPPTSCEPRALCAVGYVRVSREEQARDGVSLDAQRARIAGYAVAKALHVSAIYSDEGISGRELDRPGLSQLLDLCARRQVGHVIVWKLDRLTRCTRHLLSIVEDLFLARDIALHSVSESLDTSSPSGRFALTMLGAMAQLEREVISERTRGALAWKREHSLPTSHPPLGFRTIGRRTPMEPVGEELQVVRRILLLREQGRSYRSIAAGLNADAIKTKRQARWYHTTVSKVAAAKDWYGPHLDGVAELADTPERACPPQTVPMAAGTTANEDPLGTPSNTPPHPVGPLHRLTACMTSSSGANPPPSAGAHATPPTNMEPYPSIARRRRGAP